MNLSTKEPENKFAKGLSLKAYSRGMGAIGLPGDLSSQSRFIRASFVKMNSVSGEDEKQSVSQCFHYTSCCNTEKGIYYYTTYDNHQITAVDMNKEDLEGKELIRFEVIKEEQIRKQN